MENKSDTESLEEQHLSGLNQIQLSEEAIEALKERGEEKMSEVRVAVDQKEIERRGREEKGRQSRLIRLQNEAIASSRANETIEMRWDQLSSFQIPQELQREIDLQKSACDQIMQSKEQLIRDLHIKLREKDEDYVNNLRNQEQQVQELLTRKHTEFRNIQKRLEEEVKLIEETYEQERAQLLSHQQKELDELLTQRSGDEVTFLKRRQDREENFQEDMGQLLDQGTEKHNVLKVELESNIQSLKEQLEEIRATYQLNAEKLDYNYRVLTELDLEKTTELTRYRKRVNKLKDQVSQHKQRMRDLEEQSAKTNEQLANDHKSLTNKFKGLQTKFKHFEELDIKKYEDLWKMHDEEIRLLVDQVLAGDRVVSEQILGWGWQEPDLALLTPSTPSSNAHSANNMQPNTNTNTPMTNDTNNTTNSTHQLSTESLQSMPSNEARNTAKMVEREQRITAVKLRQMLELLVSQTNFLLDRHVQEALASLEEGEDKDSARMEKVLDALNIESEDDVRLLIDFFFAKERRKKKKKKNTATSGGGGEEEEEEEEEDEEEIAARLKTLIISPEQVIHAIQAFLDERELRSSEGGGGASGAGGSRRSTNRRSRRRGEDKWGPWERFAGVLGEEKEEGLEQLESEMGRMIQVLDTRKKLLQQVQTAQERNEHLRAALDRYLSAPVNDDLYVPPTQTIHL